MIQSLSVAERVWRRRAASIGIAQTAHFFSCVFPNLFTFRLLCSTFNEAHHIVGMYPMYYVYNFLLSTLLGLNLMWFTTIAHMIYVYLMTGQVGGVSGLSIPPSRQALLVILVFFAFFFWAMTILQCFPFLDGWLRATSRHIQLVNICFVHV